MPSSTGLVVQLRKFRDYQFMLKSATATTPHVLFMRTIVCIVRIWMWHCRKSIVHLLTVDSTDVTCFCVLRHPKPVQCWIITERWVRSNEEPSCFLFRYDSSVSPVIQTSVVFVLTMFVYRSPPLSHLEHSLFGQPHQPAHPTCCNHRVDFE